MLDNMKFEEFKKNLFYEDKSEKTIQSYLADLHSFARWFEQTNGKMPLPGDITSIDLREYKQFLLKIECLAVSTVNRRLASLRKYLTWANENGLLVTGLPALPKEVKDTRTKTAPKSLTKKQQDELLKAVERCGGNLRIRDKAVITLLLHTGLRNSELRSLQVSDIDFPPRGGWMTVNGKGNKYRKIPLNNDVRKVLSEYLDAFPALKNSLFIGTRGPKKGSTLTDVAIQQIFNKYKDQVPALRGDKEITVHSLRHTFATRMLEAGRNLVEVQALLGHENINTTAIYTRPHSYSLKAAVDCLCE